MKYLHAPCFGFIQRDFPVLAHELHAELYSLLGEVSFKLPQSVPVIPAPLPGTASSGQLVPSKETADCHLPKKYIFTVTQVLQGDRIR